MGFRAWTPASAVSGIVALALTTGGSPPAAPGDGGLASVLARGLPAVEQAGRAADHGRGGSDAVQAQYDAARDLDDALVRLPPVSRGCGTLFRTARSFARGAILEAEGYDRASPALAVRGTRLRTSAQQALSRITRDCSAGPVYRPRRAAQLLSPASGEPFDGRVRARAPAGAAEVELRVDGRGQAAVAIHARRLALRLDAAAGRHDLELRFRSRRGRLLAVQRSAGVWLLPAASTGVARPGWDDRALDARLRSRAAAFSGQTAIWVQNVRSGRRGSWNADARFPAASTVKLGLLVAALARLGPRPERTPAFYDVRQLASWSSNLAANRLLRTLAGSEAAGAGVVQATLDRLGTTASTYPGNYRVGTAVRRPIGAPDPPPLVSGRTTTARDLARILAVLASAAGGNGRALRTAGLSLHEAKLALGLLLDSQPTSDNIGLLRPWLPPGFPVAQKNGWLRQARHTAAVLYAPDGPRIAVLLTFRSAGLTRVDATLLGRSVVRAALAAS
jgi:hypothetical protein